MHSIVFDKCMCPHAYSLLPHKFLQEMKRQGKRWKKRGRVLQWQTQSVMQDYSVSFSTAIDVVFIAETQSFSKDSAPCSSSSILETKPEAGWAWRGLSQWDLVRSCPGQMAADSIPEAGKKGCPKDVLEKPPQLPPLWPHALEVGSLLHLCWCRYCITLESNKSPKSSVSFWYWDCC